MQKCQVALHLLVPANQNPTKPIHPGVGALYHPTSCLVAGFLLDGLGFLATRPNVGRETKLTRLNMDSGELGEQQGYQRTQQRLSPLPNVVNELEEA
jgi:hypothetical protein